MSHGMLAAYGSDGASATRIEARPNGDPGRGSRARRAFADAEAQVTAALLAPEVDGAPVAFGLGRRVLGAVAQALPEGVPGSEVERAFVAGGAPAREALFGVVERAAFALAVERRDLARGTGGARVRHLATPEDWPFGAAAFAPCVGAARAAFLEYAGPAFSLGPDELGALYEGMLATSVELARAPSAVVALPRSAGGAQVDRLVAANQLTQRERRRATLVPAGRVALLQSVDRRRSGSHYTPRALSERIVEATLAPLLGDEPTVEIVLGLRVCDPSLGTGAFLLAACRYLARRLEEAEARAGRPEPTALRRVAERCLFGVERDRLAIATARPARGLAVSAAACPLEFLDGALKVGDALVGAPSRAPIPAELAPQALDWEQSFPEVLARGGFDAFVGNPPWVSYAGRASQPLASGLRRVYDGYEAFRGYKNLQGLFVERAAQLLRPGGRLGLVLPSSMSELAGYAYTRAAHDRYACPDEALPDLGADAFEGVFQPCMVLASTRRAEPLTSVSPSAWPVERPDLDAAARRLIEKLALEPLPRDLFGERGLQSSGEDTEHLSPTADARHSVPVRSGGDIEAFTLRTPSAHADPAWFGARLRPRDAWQKVRLVVRQTARVPVAALSDGLAFRNSLLAGFEDADYPAAFLVAYLNATPIRWLHYVRHRDARQGMPQLKIAHLRATPAPPSRALVAELIALGVRISECGRGLGANEQAELDALVEAAFELSVEERSRLADFRAAVADARPRA